MTEKKEYQRSVRMTPTVYNYVDKQEGNGFNEKFEKLVIMLMKQEQEIKRRIKEREKTLDRLNKEIALKDSINQDLDNIKWNIDTLLSKAKLINDKYK